MGLSTSSLKSWISKAAKSGSRKSRLNVRRTHDKIRPTPNGGGLPPLGDIVSPQVQGDSQPEIERQDTLVEGSTFQNPPPLHDDINGNRSPLKAPPTPGCEAHERHSSIQPPGSHGQSPGAEEHAPLDDRGSTRSSLSHESDPWHEDHHGSPGSDVRENSLKLPISSEIDCEVIIYIDNEIVEKPKLLRIRWLERHQYKHIRRTCAKIVKTHVNPKDPKISKPFRKSAEVRLLVKNAKGLFDLLEIETVELVDHWIGKIPMLVARHAAENPYMELRLQVVQRFEQFRLTGIREATLARNIWHIVRAASESNWKGEPFLPRPQLDAIYSTDIIRQLLNQDKSLSDYDASLPEGEPSLDRHWLTDVISLNASRLLAICIDGQRDLICLHELITKATLPDTDLPLKPNVPGLQADDLDPLIQAQKRFLVYNFDDKKLKANLEKGEYEVIPDWQVLPITRLGYLGEGGFGVVEEVEIHAAHHTFKETVFALKELRATIPAASTAFAREGNVFSNLMEVKHPSILVPLAMWRQQVTGSNDRFYMLYRKGRCNLKQYMRSLRKVPTLDKAFVEHLVTQLRDLADALEAIHVLRKRSGLVESDQQQPEPARLRAPVVARPTQKTAYHHDLKPENILVLPDESWVITDFGTAGVNEAVSGRSIVDMDEVQSGDPDYSPPDHILGTRTARAYDVWCFGCILLEILVTIFDNTTADQLDEMYPDDPALHRLDVFRGDRENSVEAINTDALFWYARGDGKYELRKPVKDRLTMLARRTRDYDQFGALTQLTKDMLVIEASGRPSAGSVLGEMKKIHRQVLHNLKINEHFYLHPGTLAQPYASRPTTDGGSQGPSITPSDLLSNGRPSTHTRHLSMPERRRPRRLSGPSENMALIDTHDAIMNHSEQTTQLLGGTPSTPAVQLQSPEYAENISVTSNEESEDEETVPSQPPT